MTDPVIARDGVTYERSAIEAWLSEHGTSPSTRERMRVRDLVPNRAIKELLEQERGSERTVQSQASAEEIAAAAASASPPADLADTNTARKIADELYEIIVNTTKAKIHKNSRNPEQSLVHIETPKMDESTVSSHICCVIDVSGSMAAEASCKDERGLENKTGLSILDIVKFATLVISKSLERRDKLSIVTYSTTARTVLRPTYMNDEGKKRVEEVLEAIFPIQMTNLWGGMKMGIELAHEVGSDFVNSVFVLTDGIPNVDPPLGYERSMKRLLSKFPLFGTISTFGFGYELNSPLLSQIAKDGGGYFSFIPDAGFVGTCFINAVANARSAFGINPYLRIGTNVLKDSNSIESMSLYHKVVKDEAMNDSARMKITPLRYGTSVDIYVNHGYLRHDLQVELVFSLVGGQEVVLPVIKVDSNDESSDIFHHERDNFIQRGLNITSSTFSPGFIGTFIPSDEAKANRGTNSDIDALCKDIEGQASEAISRKDYYERWGRHYLFSLVCAHTHQFCNNFKDPGVQIYGQGELFRNLQENLNDIFEKIPAPQPSAYTVVQSNPGKALSGPDRKKYASQRPRNFPSMSKTFNNVNSVCVHGKTRVTLKCPNDDSFVYKEVPICELKKGDLVLTENNDFATVQCLVETITKTTLNLIQIGTLQVTPYHPIKLGSYNSWEFPVNFKDSSVVQSSSHSVYNLVLDKEDRHKGVMMEDGIASITLGHGINDDATLKHDYFGTDRVVHDLEKISSGWKSGHIVLREEDIKRAAVSGEICSISVSQCHATTANASRKLCKA
eukprot:CAMPEP_0203664068 /NCGR_PEP_ID=MMETSP0090-20130426/1554_1 /ASSEMBLY_ACC=CAM_ASM_001088 /TAXON_ID=426623 /ORGANISM="Chaetoceros affinis, Strain CCMP159" /LENGTH=787 /DNA_ID=CAMNT_0050527179 /DNA_START=123 /DNA_END=2486 /DNA_ORIENTATION=+